MSTWPDLLWNCKVKLLERSTFSNIKQYANQKRSNKMVLMGDLGMKKEGVKGDKIILV